MQSIEAEESYQLDSTVIRERIAAAARLAGEDDTLDAERRGRCEGAAQALLWTLGSLGDGGCDGGRLVADIRERIAAADGLSAGDDTLDARRFGLCQGAAQALQWALGLIRDGGGVSAPAGPTSRPAPG